MSFSNFLSSTRWFFRSFSKNVKFAIISKSDMTPRTLLIFPKLRREVDTVPVDCYWKFPVPGTCVPGRIPSPGGTGPSVPVREMRDPGCRPMPSDVLRSQSLFTRVCLRPEASLILLFENGKQKISQRRKTETLLHKQLFLAHNNRLNSLFLRSL